MTEDRVEFRTPKTMPPTAGYHHIAVVPPGATTLYLSGQVPFDTEGNLVGQHDFAGQAEQVFRNIEAALRAVGADFGDVVKLGMFVSDMSNIGALREVRDRFIDMSNPPTSTLVEVSGFIRPEIMLEVDAIAVLGPT
ncbi:MAG: RidA family protein [Acidimicrobiia bacterium]|jgi:enamine deaminase RidA (YjgF/YER057c/UK114 family)